MITIDMKNVKTKINNINQIPFTALDEICETLSYKLSGFGVDTRRHYLINPSTGITYTGLFPRIIPILKKYGITYKLNDTRRPKLTLRHLNKLRKYREFKQSEMAQRDAIVAIVYQTPEENTGSGGLSL